MSTPEIVCARFEVPRWAELVGVDASEHRQVHHHVFPVVQKLAAGLIAHLDPGAPVERSEVEHRVGDSSWPRYDTLQQTMDTANWLVRLSSGYVYHNPRDGDGVDAHVDMLAKPMGGRSLRVGNNQHLWVPAVPFDVTAVRWEGPVSGLFEAVGRILGEAFGCQARRLED